MRRTRVVIIAVLLLLILPSTLGESASVQKRDVTRLVATPTPLGPLQVGRDDASWRVDVPDGAVVVVEAVANATTPFHLRWHQLGTPDPQVSAPVTHRWVHLAGPASWRVVVDPAAGAQVHVRLTFTGTYVDEGGTPAPFTLTDLTREKGCVVPGVCLP